MRLWPRHIIDLELLALKPGVARAKLNRILHEYLLVNAEFLLRRDGSANLRAGVFRTWRILKKDDRV